MGKNNNKPASNKDDSALKLLLPMMAAAIVAVLLSSGGLYWYQSQISASQQQQALARQLADSQLATINDWLERSRQQLALLANRPDLNHALTDDTDTLKRYRDQWLPGATVDVVPNNDQAISQYSYLAQELLNDSRLGKTPKAVISAGKNPSLLMARPTANGQGSILFSQSLAPLKAQLTHNLPTGSAMTVSDGGNRIYQLGQAHGGNSRASASADGLSVQITRSTPGSDILIVAGAIGAGVLIILITTYVMGLRLGRVLRQDAAELINYCKELSKRADVTARNRLHFPVFGQVTQAQAKLAGQLRSHGGGAVKRPPVNTRTEEAMVVDDQDDGLLLVDESPEEAIPEGIFRAYDIRGVAGDTFTAHTAYLLGRAIGTEAGEAGQQSVIVARDGRLSSPELSRSLVKGLLESGRDVINIGDVPTPVLYYATKVLESQTGICVTGSHNPARDNGLKIVISDDTLHGDRILALHQRIKDKQFSSGQGKEEERDISDRYVGDIINDIVLARPLKIAVDCGNGITGNLGPRIFAELGCEVTPLYSEVDGNFPNHHPDPSKPENLAELIRTVQQEKLDLGLAFDGDGDRVAVVTPQGEIIWPDRLMMLFARDLLGRTPGADILFDVKCSRALPSLIRKCGGRPLMYKTGHSLIKAKMKESGAPLAGEMSGHIFFADRWFGFDDGIYAGARLLEILSLQDDDADQVFAALQTGLTTPEIQIPVSDETKFDLVDALSKRAEQFSGGRATTIDGLRVDFPDGWGLVRASNTTPVLVARFEGRDEEALQRVQTQFHNHLLAVDDSLKLPF
ncbi:phosphoglucomutase/phosphomannomutase [Alcanivorax hongdengensis A-11-3]|uniref:phosphomannomutase n=1 Tax=Alcanivorax hongdengensis A-11-3 TaxID=1177179 RepID=L0WC34_9GAMM|nr:phosphomannomutase/phosphoglucomutase [Alcanivorax hongdengensis]EKF74338.1 phosphoglucomutase/phosphomannomutase [Alcanivorax hongdengensis A-11-3]